jgi:hypothetical protein
MEWLLDLARSKFDIDRVEFKELFHPTFIQQLFIFSTPAAFEK